MTGLYTFGLVYDGEVTEEIDVRADSYSAARAEALRQAEADYRPGWDRLVSLEPGGSGGLFQIL